VLAGAAQIVRVQMCSIFMVIVYYKTIKHLSMGYLQLYMAYNPVFFSGMHIPMVAVGEHLVINLFAKQQLLATQGELGDYPFERFIRYW